MKRGLFWIILSSCFFSLPSLIFAQSLPAAKISPDDEKRSAIVEANGYAYLSEDKTIKALRQEADADAKRQAAAVWFWEAGEGAWAQAEKSERGVQIRNAAPASQGWGNYHALIVGINSYQEWTPLTTAVNDARALREILIKQYGFTSDRIILKTDEQATLSQITNELRNIAGRLKPIDNLLIYFAGHGHLDDLTGEGYWIPVEGKLKDPSTWLAHSMVKNILSSERVMGKNIVVVADSCYAGTLLRGGPSLLSMGDARYQERLRELAIKKSRQVITSGGNEPVSDGGREGHSLFAYYFLKALRENNREVVDLENLFHSGVWKPVAEIGGQRPNAGRLKTPMDEDGQFVLVRAAGVAPRAGPDELALAEERRKLEEERAQVAALRQLIEEQRKLEEERKRLDAERKQLEEERKKRDGEEKRVAMAKRPGKTSISSIINSIGMEFVLIPAGKFAMGSPSSESGRYADEKPQHDVAIPRPFYMGKYEVTQGQWRQVMGNNPSNFKNCGNDCPMENISWSDAQEFIRRLNEKENTDRYGLPTEEEWEYACRAGSLTAYSFGDNAGSLDEYAWYSSNSGNRTHQVGQKGPNSWGLYDMQGNVWEWCSDSVIYTQRFLRWPTEPESRFNRLIRGGGLSDSSRSVRCARRLIVETSYKGRDLGLRLVRTIE